MPTELIYFEIEKRAEGLAKYYQGFFKDRYGTEASKPEYEDMTTLRWLCEQYKDDEQCRVFLRQYLTHDDDWIKKQGYALRYLKKTLQALIVANAPINTSLPKEHWVVNYTVIGKPVISHNKYACKGETNFKPVLFEDWKKLGIEGKLQMPYEKWKLVGNDVDQWVLNWMEWGFLPH